MKVWMGEDEAMHGFLCAHFFHEQRCPKTLVLGLFSWKKYRFSSSPLHESMAKEEFLLQGRKGSSKLTKMVVIALLATVSFVLFFLSFPLPLLPPYLKVDFSDVPALLAGLIFSPMAGVLVVFLKNLMYFVVKGATDPIGIPANFIAGSLYVFPVAYLYHKYKKGVKSIIAGLVIGTLVMAVIMSILNYLIILPAYLWVSGVEEGLSSSAKMATVLSAILPFNLLKGIIVALLFIPLFIKMREWIEQKRTQLLSS